MNPGRAAEVAAHSQRDTLFITLASLSGNGYHESFNGKLRDERLAREIFYTLEEAKVLIGK